MQILFGLLCLFIALAYTGKAQASVRPPSQEVASNQGAALVPRNIQFTRIATREGLSQASVNAIMQDQFGMIWFGTQEGLNRYDGYEIVVYEHLQGVPGTLSHDWVWSVYLDDRGTMWVGTDGGGLNRYDRAEDKFTHFRHDPQNPSSLSSDRVRVIFQDALGALWIGTDGGGLNRFDRDTGEFTHFRHVESEPDSLPGNTVLTIFEDSKGKLWIGTDNGLARMNRARNRFFNYRHDPSKPASLSNDQVRRVFEDSLGQIWVGTYKGGLNLLDRSRNSFHHLQHDPEDPRSLSHNRVRDIFQDMQGTLWVATDQGLNEWLPSMNGFARYMHDPSDPSSVSDNRITTLFQDEGGVLWVGTVNGVNKWNYISDAFSYFEVAQDGTTQLSGNVITAIDESEGDVVWVGTYGGGLNRIDMVTGSATHYRYDHAEAGSLSDDRVMAVHVDQDNTLWVGTRNGGLDRFDPATGLFDHYRHDPATRDSLSSNSVTSIHSDRDGILWVGTYGGGLNRFDPASGKFTVYRHDAADNSTLSSDRVLDIYRDRAGALWVGTEDGGLNRFNEANNTFVRYAHDPANADSLGSDAAWDILETEDGALWVATMGGGLNHWDSSDRAADLPVFRKYLKASGLRSDTVFGIVEDEEGFLWLSSNRGLSRLNPEDGSVRNFDSFNGLRGDEFNFGPHLQTRSGRLLFGGPTGIVSFHPDELLINTHTPAIFLTAHSRDRLLAMAYSAEQGEPETITLGYDEDYVQFKFAALDYASSDKNQYRFKLDGFDKEWVDPGKIRRAVYTSLPAGDYLFIVKASNNDGIWNDQGISIRLHVEPPPWKTPFAYSIYTLFLGGTLIGYRRKQNKKFKKVEDRNEALENEVAARTQELSKRNEQLKLLNEKLRKASVTDSLTGLHNRRFLDEFIDTEIARVDRRLEGAFLPESDSNTVSISPALFFMMIDLDGFKGINDAYGHLAGDAALVQVRDVLRKSCRASDTIIRWGGDEFMVVGNTASPRAVEMLAERIRVTLANHQFELGGGNVGRLSGSVGFSMYPFSPGDPGSATWEQIVSLADLAAYAAKQNGGNAWVGAYGSKTYKWEELSTSGVDLPALARQGVLDVKSSLEQIESSRDVRAQEKV